MIHYGGGSVIRNGLLDRFKESLAVENIPFAELGAKEEDIPELAEKFSVTNIGNNGATGGFVKLTKEDAVTIYKIALNAFV